MGIKGIYKEIGTGERTALSKLAVQHLENTGRPFRLAIDISIWRYQIQSGQGGRNPALRTLYYRLLRLLGLSIQPLFVFDGPQRPSFKRGVKIAMHAACLDNFLTKHLLECFGFPFHDAPGEAEAECALLQKEGIVDAVLSEDVDTLMFGCTLSLRNWTAEGSRGSKSPTHVDVHRSERTKETSGLDSEGMILAALMSGGDYVQEGIPKCGIKTACQAARAGFGRELCRLAKDDDQGLRDWRQRLQHEIRSNESRFFSKKHQMMTIPEDFPDKKIFSYYTHPVVSSPNQICRLRESIKWATEFTVTELRAFVAEEFHWRYLTGAKHFIRGLAPVLLADKLIKRGGLEATDRETLGTKALAEINLVRTISGRRNNWTTDGEPELRIAYVPADVVGLDISAEEEGPADPEVSDENAEDGAGSENEARQRSRSPTKRPFTYDPTQLEKFWMLETFVKLGAPLRVDTWEEDMRNPKKFASRKAREKATLANARKQKGTMDRFVKITKPGIDRPEGKPDYEPPVFLAPATAVMPGSPRKKALRENRQEVGKKMPSEKVARPNKTEPPSVGDQVNTSQNAKQNPWTLAKGSTKTEPAHSMSEAVLLIHSGSEEDAAGIPTPVRSSDFVTQRSNRRNRNKHARSRSASSTDNKDHASGVPATGVISTPKRNDPLKPSPRKKRSPLQLVNELYLPGQLMTPRSKSKDRDCVDLFESTGEEERGSPRRVNRRLNFTTTPQRPISPSITSEADSLPSPSALLSPPASQPLRREAGQLPPMRSFPPAKQKSFAKSLVAVRESLEGTWKNVSPGEVRRLGVAKKMYSSVEVLDLTGG